MVSETEQFNAVSEFRFVADIASYFWNQNNGIRYEV
jgi:hypothetical protein